VEAEADEEDDEPCAICLDAFTEEEPQHAPFRCVHGFHLTCVREWRASCEIKQWEWSCPMCRQCAV
jgi:hypothetical protein